MSNRHDHSRFGAPLDGVDATGTHEVGGRVIPVRRVGAPRQATPVASAASAASIRAAGAGGGDGARDRDDTAGGADRAGFQVNDRRWWAQDEPGDAGAGAAAADDKPSYVRTLEAEIERLKLLVDEKDRVAREYATRARQSTEQSADEIERAKERIRKDASREIERSRRDLLVGFLSVADDLDRALASATAGGEASALTQGVELVRKRLLATLAQSAVVPVPAMGQRFDPALHDAVSQVPVTDPAQDGAVVGVVREGYRIGDDVLRPAMVAVGKL